MSMNLLLLYWLRKRKLNGKKLGKVFPKQEKSKMFSLDPHSFEEYFNSNFSLTFGVDDPLFYFGAEGRVENFRFFLKDSRILPKDLKERLLNLAKYYDNIEPSLRPEETMDSENCKKERAMGFSRAYEYWSIDEKEELDEVSFMLYDDLRMIAIDAIPDKFKYHYPLSEEILFYTVEILGNVFKRHPKAIIYRFHTDCLRGREYNVSCKNTACSNCQVSIYNKIERSIIKQTEINWKNDFFDKFEGE